MPNAKRIFTFGMPADQMVRPVLLAGFVLLLLGIALLGLVLHSSVDRGFEEAALERSTQDATHISHIFHYTVWSPVNEILPDVPFDEAVHPAMMDVFSQRSTFGLGVVGLNVRQMDGSVIWSSNPSGFDDQGESRDWWYAAVVSRGETVSRFAAAQPITDLAGETRTADIVRVFTPVFDTPFDGEDEGNVIGVLEVTRDVTADRAAARSAFWQDVALASAGATLLFLVGGTVVIWRGKRAERANRQIEERSAASTQTRTQQVQSARLAVVGEMVASVAHELNNPLTAIWGLSQLGLKQDVDPVAARRMEMINKEAGRSVRIVQNILSFSRARASDKSYVSINAAVEAALELRRYQLVVNGIDLEVNLDPTMPRTMADPHKIQQVVLNLITNAEQALEEVDSPKSVRVSTERRDDWLHLVVGDTGPGISEDELGRIFDPFYTTKADGKGTGLGLSISYSIIEEHHGSIEVKSKLGEGTEFTILLPVMRPGREEDGGGAKAEPPSTRQQ
ncbi:MAG: ATP-binding protein [Dehalococcoidia bacterium]